jgi:hypothetical protein
MVGGGGKGKYLIILWIIQNKTITGRNITWLYCRGKITNIQQDTAD